MAISNILRVLRNRCAEVVTNIDTGNTNITQEDAETIADLLAFMNEPRLNKYEACRFIGKQRSRFDALVREGKIPKGKKRAGSNELTWAKRDLQRYIDSVKNTEA